MNDMQARTMFRSKLRTQMKRVEIKVVTLAKLVGVSASQVSRWTEGSLMPTWDQFQRVLEVFGVDDSYMLGNSISEKSYTARFK